MEKYYVVNKGTKIYNDLKHHFDTENKIIELMKEFGKTHNIKSNEFYMSTKRLAIVPTKEDEENFGQYFLKGDKPGFFKMNSPLCKEWVQLCKKEGLEYKHFPFFVTTLFKSPVGGSYRAFELNGEIYFTYKSDCNFVTPDDFTEVKASEFFKIMEDNNVQLN